MRYRAAGVASLLIVCLLPAAVAEEARTSLGVLTCTVVTSANDQARNMSCGFKPTGSGPEEKYGGSVRGSQQPQLPGKLVLVWVVLGRTVDKLPAGFLAQRYVAAESAPGKVPALVGEKNPTIALQPETNTDTGTFAATEVVLELTGTPA
jgi:hypothetical protein